MQLGEAKNVAREWVAAHAAQMPGFYGAFFHGSSNWLADDATLPLTSDLDVLIVLRGPEPPTKPGKFVSHGVLLEVSFVQQSEVASPEVILSTSHMAGSFHGANIIADPTGELTAIQAVVSREYAKRRWVRKRCEHARGKILNNLHSIDPNALFHDQVLSWLFGTGVTTHILLVAGLKNPTVRKRYVDVRTLLEEYGRADFYPELLALLGCAEMTRAQAEQHLATLEEAFDAAGKVIKTPVFFAADLGEMGRPVAIDGSRDLIAQGLHREAVFWIVATYGRCMNVFAADAPMETYERYDAGYRRLLGDLGIASPADIAQRSAEVEAFLPRVWEVAEFILAKNPAIEED